MIARTTICPAAMLLAVLVAFPGSPAIADNPNDRGDSTHTWPPNMHRVDYSQLTARHGFAARSESGGYAPVVDYADEVTYADRAGVASDAEYADTAPSAAWTENSDDFTDGPNSPGEVSLPDPP